MNGLIISQNNDREILLKSKTNKEETHSGEICCSFPVDSYKALAGKLWVPA
jgi:hypothetical protein